MMGTHYPASLILWPSQLAIYSLFASRCSYGYLLSQESGYLAQLCRPQDKGAKQ